jgi:hypothetical protein
LEFEIWDAADSRDRACWIERWRQWPAREVFAHPDYLLLYARRGVHARCAAGAASGSYTLYPFLMRELSEEPYCEASLRECTDITSPYGYGGPFAWGGAWDRELAVMFWRRFDDWASRSHVISEVIRLSLFPATVMPYAGSAAVVSENIVRSLTISADELWRDFEHKVRKNVNKARQSGVTIEMDESGGRLDDFLRIYRGTMERRNAASCYFFPRQYFDGIHRRLKGQFTYFHALLGSTVVSTELVLISADRVYSFLGGTDASYFHLRPNDLLKFEVMRWAHRAGRKEFVLGGGYSPGDGIYRFKLSLAPHGRIPFSIGFRVLDIRAYAALVQRRRASAIETGGRWDPQPGFFPAYRSEAFQETGTHTDARAELVAG